MTSGGAELRIYFPDLGQQMEFPPGIDVRDGNEPGILRINNNHFWWQLVRAGFRLGTNHDLARLRQGIPAKCLGVFENGFNS
jgi:hypothetical protein